MTASTLLRELSHRGITGTYNRAISLKERYAAPKVEFDAATVRDSATELNRAAATLRDCGAIVLRGLYTAADTEPLTERALKFLESIEKLRNADPRNTKDSRFLFQNALQRKLGGYGGCVKQKKPVINFRMGGDDGLIDVFHPERLKEMNGPGAPIDDQKKENLVCKLVSVALDRTLTTRVRNLYLTDSVRQTRGFHVDGFSIKAKSFLYLTDVESNADGPYCYALGTHQASKRLKKLNRSHNEKFKHRRDDFPIHGLARRFTFLGQRGDLIISLQYGAHRGLPQKWRHRRLALVHTAT